MISLIEAYRGHFWVQAKLKLLTIAGMSSIYSGNKLFHVACSKLELASGSELIWLEPYSSPVYTMLSWAKPSLLKSSRAWLRFGPGQYQVLGLFTTSFSPCLRAGSGTRCSCTFDDPDHWVADGCLLTIVPRTIAHLILRPGEPLASALINLSVNSYIDNWPFGSPPTARGLWPSIKWSSTIAQCFVQRHA